MRKFNKEVTIGEDYLVNKFTKEELEQLLLGKVVRFWTKDCSIMPDFDITGPVNQISYFNNNEISITILRSQTSNRVKTLSLSSKMANLKFRIISS